ncbi:MAG: endonuclease domain-containing protein [Devosia sp.]
MREPTSHVARAKRLRRAMTLPEILIWQELRRKQLSKHFRRQHPVGPYVLDFYCSKAKLCVEVDGGAHDVVSVALRDERRDAWLASQGIRVLRFNAVDILEDRLIDGVLQVIDAALAGTLDT